MIDANDYTKLEAIFRQEHENLFEPVIILDLQYQVIAIDIDNETSRKLAAALKQTKDPEKRREIEARIASALAKEYHREHPSNHFDNLRKSAKVLETIAAFAPIIDARRVFAQKKRADLRTAEAELSSRFSIAAFESPGHSWVNLFEAATRLHQMLIDRHRHPSFSTVMPGSIASIRPLDTPAPARPPESIVDVRERRGEMDRTVNEQEAREQSAKQQRAQNLKTESEKSGRRQREEIANARAGATARPFIKGKVIQTVNPIVELANEDAVEPVHPDVSGIPAAPGEKEVLPEGVGEEEISAAPNPVSP
jgi:hypothetical protein